MGRAGPRLRVALGSSIALGSLAVSAPAAVDVSGPANGLAVAPFSETGAVSKSGSGVSKSGSGVSKSGSGVSKPDPGGSKPGPASADLDVASVLAQQLDSRSGLRVVAPDALRRDARGLSDPQAADVRRWARWNQVENVLIGRSDDLGVAVELRSGHSGAALAEYRVATDSSDSSEALNGAVERLAVLILADLGEVVTESPTPAVSAAADGAPSATRGGEPLPGANPKADSLALLPAARREDPISINSDELEVVPEAGGRRLVFSRNVEVLQGDVTLNANRLEAVYPQGASQPDQLRATGDVRVHQGDRRARCDEATYERSAQTIVCRGRAEVTQGCDRVRGQEIEFDLVRERVRVSGAASVVIQPEDADPGECADGTAPAEARP
jgi:lipopolysaccharide export system protein LptA